MNMNDDVLFWKVIDSTTALESEPDKQLAALRTALSKLPLEQIERYESSFDSEMKRSFSWDLSGAAYVVHGGASDDSFEYFRCWLISKGKRVFEKVLADPDSLADIVAPDVRGVLEFEDFAYVARTTWGVGSRARKCRMPQGCFTPIGSRPGFPSMRMQLPLQSDIRSFGSSLVQVHLVDRLFVPAARPAFCPKQRSGSGQRRAFRGFPHRIMSLFYIDRSDHGRI